MDTHDGREMVDDWKPAMIEVTQSGRPGWNPAGALFFVVPGCVMVPDIKIMGHFLPGKFGEVWNVFYQFVLFVLQVAFIRLNSAEPGGSSKIEVALVPLARADGRGVTEYMLVVTTRLGCKVKIDAVMSEAARSETKVFNVDGQFVQPDARRRDDGGGAAASDIASTPSTLFVHVSNARNLEILYGMYTNKPPPDGETPASAVFTLANAIRNMSRGVHHRMTVPSNYTRVDGMLTLPVGTTYCIVEPRYISPDAFLKQTPPHAIGSDLETAFKAGVSTLNQRAASAPPVHENGPAAAAAAAIGLDRRPPTDQTIEQAIDAHAALRLRQAEASSAENEQLCSLRETLRTHRRNIEHARSRGVITEDECERWRHAARLKVLEQYERLCVHEHSRVSQVARDYHKFAQEHAEDPPFKLNIPDPTLSVMDNFRIYLADVLTNHYNVATHQVVIVDLYILMSSMFSSDPVHVILMGEGGTGKSYAVDVLRRILGKFCSKGVDSASRGRTWMDEIVHYGVKVVDEFDPTVGVKDGDGKIGEAKSIITNGQVTREVMVLDSKTGKRRLVRYVCVQKVASLNCMNKNEVDVQFSVKSAEAASIAALMSRYSRVNIGPQHHPVRSLRHVGALRPEERDLGPRSEDAVAADLVLLMRACMLVWEMIFIGLLPPPDLSQFDSKGGKFDEVMAQHQQGAIRITPKTRKAVECNVIVRSLLEHLHAPGSPFYGRAWTPADLLSMPLVCTLDDVIKGCTFSSGMYIPRDLGVVGKMCRQACADGLASLDNVTYRNPHTRTERRPVFRTLRQIEQRAGGNEAIGGGMAPMGYHHDMAPYVEPEQDPEFAERPASYVCFERVSREGFTKMLLRYGAKQAIPPADMATRSCVNILQNTVTQSREYVWAPPRPGEVRRAPWISEGDAAKYPRPLIEFADGATYVHVSLLSDGNSSYENTWREALGRMCSQHTVPRRILTCIPHDRHPFIMEDYVIEPSGETAVSLNPHYVSPTTAISLTGDPTQNASRLTCAPIIELDMDSDLFHLATYYHRLHPRSSPPDAMAFAQFYHPVSITARTRAAMSEGAARGAFSYPADRIAEMDFLVAAISPDAPNPQVGHTIRTTDLIAMMGGEGEGDARDATEALAHTTTALEQARYATTADDYANMMGAERGASVGSIVCALGKRINPLLHAELIVGSAMLQESPQTETAGDPPSLFPRDVDEEDARKRGRFEDEDEDEPEPAQDAPGGYTIEYPEDE